MSNYKSGQINTYGEHDGLFDLDPELIKLWNTLCVTDDYRKKFQQKLRYFKEESHWLLLNYEKESLKKIYEYIMVLLTYYI